MDPDEAEAWNDMIMALLLSADIKHETDGERHTWTFTAPPGPLAQYMTANPDEWVYDAQNEVWRPLSQIVQETVNDHIAHSLNQHRQDVQGQAQE